MLGAAGTRYSTQPNSKKNARIAKLLEAILSSVSDALKAPVCKSEVELDLRSQLIRVQEVGPFRPRRLPLCALHR